MDKRLWQLTSITVEEAINFLNEINELDPDALLQLINFRVKCNMKLANHPTVQVRKIEDGWDVNLLGLLNGIFGVHPKTQYGHINMDCEGDYPLKKINGFNLTKHPDQMLTTETMRITVNTTEGSFGFQVLKTCLIDQLIETVVRCVGYAQSDHYALHLANGQQMDNDKTLADYDVKSKDTLTLSDYGRCDIRVPMHSQRDNIS